MSDERRPGERRARTTRNGTDRPGETPRGQSAQQVRQRAAVHAALADPARLQIVDLLGLGDASPSELAESLGLPSNLLAHHVSVLERAGVIVRTRSEGDRRRVYLHLVPASLDTPPSQLTLPPPPRMLFVCAANSARSHLAAALWRQVSPIPAVSAGTHPAPAIAQGARESAHRHGLPLPDVPPRHISEVRTQGDLLVTVCDRAHEELPIPVDVHWSVPDPVPIGTPEAFDRALEQIAQRVDTLAARWPTPRALSPPKPAG